MDGSEFIERLDDFGDREAMVWRGGVYSYSNLLRRIERWREILTRQRLDRGSCVAFCGDFSPGTAALMIALFTEGHVAIPLTRSVLSREDREQRSVYAAAVFEFDDRDDWEFRLRSEVEGHPLLDGLRERGEAGLVLFSSGSTGRAKASLHSYPRLLSRFGRRGRAFRVLTFLLLDHMGGVNTLLSVFANGGTAITTQRRSAEAVCQAVQDHRVDLLPVTPTFLNMLLISEAHRRFDLSSVEYISYGTEPMPAATLAAIREAFPGVKLRQLYGLTELGILPTRTHADDALRVKLGGDGCEVKVVDGILWVRAPASMLGYLNAPSPFDEDGWFNTGDAVVAEDGYFRILGRESELINVGGEKVFPAEVESVILQVKNIRDVVVWGKPNPITGSVVAASVLVVETEESTDVERRVRQHCRERLAEFKVPALVEVLEHSLHSPRFKRIRRPQGSKNCGVKP